VIGIQPHDIRYSKPTRILFAVASGTGATHQWLLGATTWGELECARAPAVFAPTRAVIPSCDRLARTTSEVANAVVNDSRFHSLPPTPEPDEFPGSGDLGAFAGTGPSLINELYTRSATDWFDLVPWGRQHERGMKPTYVAVLPPVHLPTCHALQNRDVAADGYEQPVAD
jgi:hypothetical protein